MNKLKAVSESTNPNPNPSDTGKRQTIDLGNGSKIIYISRFLPFDESWKWFDYLNKEIPWTRPTIRFFGRSCVQPRDTCYVASLGLPGLSYSGYRPHAYSWDDYPPLKDILEAVHKALPGSSFDSLLLNGYKGGNDYAGWHSDDEKLYGLTPEIASVSFGCQREFLLKKKKPGKASQEKRSDDEPVSKRPKKSNHADQHSFTLKHGSLLVMRGYTQRDWIHSVPKRAKAEQTQINLTFRFWDISCGPLSTTTFDFFTDLLGSLPLVTKNPNCLFSWLPKSKHSCFQKLTPNFGPRLPFPCCVALLPCLWANEVNFVTLAHWPSPYGFQYSICKTLRHRFWTVGSIVVHQLMHGNLILRMCSVPRPQSLQVESVEQELLVVYKPWP